MEEHALTLKVLPDVIVQLTPMESFAKLVIIALFIQQSGNVINSCLLVRQKYIMI